MSSPRVRTNSFPSCTFGLYTAISVWPLGFNLSCSLTRQHMPETVSVRKVNGLPRASFSRNLAVQALPLAMCLAPPPALRDFHPVEFAHAERTSKSRRYAKSLRLCIDVGNRPTKLFVLSNRLGGSLRQGHSCGNSNDFLLLLFFLRLLSKGDQLKRSPG